MAAFADIAGLVVSLGAAFIAWKAFESSNVTSGEQTGLQTRVTSIEEDRRADEIAREEAEAEERHRYPASKVHAWTTNDGHHETLIWVHNAADEPVYDVVVWAWPLLLEPPEIDQAVPEWPDFPDSPTVQYLWIGSLGPGDRQTIDYYPTQEERKHEPIGTLFEVEFTDGQKRSWSRSHDGTLNEGMRRPYAC